MKKLLIPAIALIAIALASCNKPTPPAEAAQPPIDSVGEKNKELVKAYMETVLTGKTDQMAGYLSDNFMSRGPGIKDSSNREQSVDSWTKNWKEQFSSIKFDPIAELAVTIKPDQDSRNAGDWVLKWGTISAEYKNGMPPVKFSLHLACKVVNGKIAFIVDYYNVADILAQQGFTFVPPKKK